MRSWPLRARSAGWLLRSWPHTCLSRHEVCFRAVARKTRQEEEKEMGDERQPLFSRLSWCSVPSATIDSLSLSLSRTSRSNGREKGPSRQQNTAEKLSRVLAFSLFLADQSPPDSSVMLCGKNAWLRPSNDLFSSFTRTSS